MRSAKSNPYGRRCGKTGVNIEGRATWEGSRKYNKHSHKIKQGGPVSMLPTWLAGVNAIETDSRAASCTHIPNFAFRAVRASKPAKTRSPVQYRGRCNILTTTQQTFTKPKKPVTLLPGASAMVTGTQAADV